MIYDLIVMGAGPAGCAAAITAAEGGARVLLLERGRFPRHKVCGEFVSAESLGLLETLLNPEYRSMIIGAPRISRGRIFSDGAEIPAEINPPAASIARRDLDHALWNSAATRGVKAIDECVVQSVELTSEGTAPSRVVFQITTQRGTFTARALVNATGRWSILTSRHTRASAGKDRWVGVKAHFYEVNASPSVDLYFFPGGYCGVQPVTSSGEGGASLINACAMVRADVASNLDQVLQLHSELRARSAHWKPTMDPVSTSPLIFHKPEPLQGDMLQAGDAATFVDPFIGDGISLGLRSGRLAAECLQPFFRQQCSLKQASADYEQRYRQELAYVFRASSQLRNFMKLPGVVRRPVMSILQRTPVITQRLVRMTR